MGDRLGSLVRRSPIVWTTTYCIACWSIGVLVCVQGQVVETVGPAAKVTRVPGQTPCSPASMSLGVGAQPDRSAFAQRLKAVTYRESSEIFPHHRHTDDGLDHHSVRSRFLLSCRVRSHASWSLSSSLCNNQVIVVTPQRPRHRWLVFALTLRRTSFLGGAASLTPNAGAPVATPLRERVNHNGAPDPTDRTDICNRKAGRPLHCFSIHTNYRSCQCFRKLQFWHLWIDGVEASMMPVSQMRLAPK